MHASAHTAPPAKQNADRPRGFEALRPLAAPARLFTLAVNLLRRHGDETACRELQAAVQADTELLAALCAEYLKARAADMAGTSLPLSGHVTPADEATIGAPPQRQRGGGAGQYAGARPASKTLPSPTSPSYLAAARREGPRLFTTALDSVKVRDGRAIGDVPWSGIERLIGANSREAHLLRLVRDHIGGTPADPNAPIRTLIDADTFARLHQQSAERSDAQG